MNKLGATLLIGSMMMNGTTHTKEKESHTDTRVQPAQSASSQIYNDAVLFDLLDAEKARQERTIDLIASENYASKEVMEATGSVLTNKYAEGYAGARYYEGCAVVDEVERLAIQRCKQLFGSEFANVQAHSGSNANMAAYAAILKPGDLIMGMSLADGGHLTHGHKVNFSGKVYHTVQYTLNPETGLLDYDAIERMAEEHKPQVIVAGASAYSRTIDFERFAQIAHKVGAKLVADVAHIAGLVVTGLHPHPFPHADIVTSTVHKTLRGARGGIILTNDPDIAKAINKEVMPGTQGGPLLHSIAGKAVAFLEALQPEFKEYQKQIMVNADCFASELQKRDYKIVSGGTDNHLFVVDLTSKKISGKKAAKALEKAGIVVSKSCIPNDPRKPWVTSGIRIGTPALTTRGMKEPEVIKIAEWFDLVIQHHADDQMLDNIRKEVETLCSQFPIYN